MKNIISVLVTIFCLNTLWSQDSSAIQTEVLSRSTVSWDGKPLPNYGQGKPEITILKIIIPPGAQLPFHQHPVINAGFLLSGELTVVTEDNKTLHLKAGESLLEVVNTWHYGKNEGTTPAEIIVFYAGTKDSLITIKKEIPKK